MSYLPKGVPGPAPTLDERPFWEHCARKVLAFQRCGACGLFRHPPSPVCPRCRSFDTVWTEAPRIAHLYTYTIVHHAQNAAVAEAVPYNVALVAFPKCDGVRLITNIVDTRDEELEIGRTVELVWQPHASGVFLPLFRLAKAGN